MSELRENSYTVLADKIINILDEDGEMTTPELLNLMDSDPVLTKFILGFLLKFEFIEYDRERDSVKLCEGLRNMI